MDRRASDGEIRIVIVLFDLNVLLDLFLNRSPWAVEASSLWLAHANGFIKGHVSAASVPTLFYVMSRQLSRERAFQGVDDCVQTLHVVSVDRQTIARARSLAGNDFEDDLQIACAVEIGAEVIVSRDPGGFTHSPVPVLSPTELLERLANKASSESNQGQTEQPKS